VRQQNAYPTNAVGAAKTTCNAPRATSPSLIVCLYLDYSKKLLQELSYRKQIARKLRTQ